MVTFPDASVHDALLLAAMNRELITDERHRNPMSDAQLVERMRGWLADTGDCGYRAVIFECDGKSAGYALYRDETDHVYLRQFYVARTHRRRGIGRVALTWLWEHRWRDVPHISVDVLIGNAAGIAFWRAAGFQDYCLILEAAATG